MACFEREGNESDSDVLVCVTDPRVLYSEPSKLVAKLRDMKTDNNTLLFKCEMGAGHFSKTGRLVIVSLSFNILSEKNLLTELDSS